MYVESLIYLAFQSWLFSVLIQFAEAEMDCIWWQQSYFYFGIVSLSEGSRTKNVVVPVKKCEVAVERVT